MKGGFKHLMSAAVIASMFLAVSSAAFAAEATSPLKVELVSINKTVKPGDKVTLKVKTAPGARCRIEAQDAGILQEFALMDRTADKNGFVTWQWKVKKDYKGDKMPVIVTAASGGKEEKLVTDIKIDSAKAQATSLNVQVLSFEKKTHPGAKVTLKVKTSPGADCKIDIEGMDLTQLPNLRPKTADNKGHVSWTWKVPNDYKADKLPVIVTASKTGQVEKLITSLDVHKKGTM